MAKIAEHESNNAHGSTVGLNEFSDWTEAELKRLLSYQPREITEEPELLEVGGPSAWDWRDHGAVQKVKNQGQCGSCWAFSSTGAVEGANFLKNKRLDSYSEQQLVDCSKQNNGCNGGLMDYAFQYIKTAPLMTEANYPYKGRHGKCEYVKSKGVGTVSAYHDVRADTTGAQLMAAI